MFRKYKFVFTFLLGLSVLTIVYLSLPLNNSNCNIEAIFTSKTAKYQVYATKVVIQPWLGEHHVYGIFMVPDKYEQTPFFVFTVKGAGSYCQKPFGTLQQIDGISAKPGMHLIRDYLKTRTALRLILQGSYNQLNNKYNWMLTYPLN
ncbi:hypothetical protein NUACC21_40920 [Scytonema sp. NUACC21]